MMQSVASSTTTTTYIHTNNTIMVLKTNKKQVTKKSLLSIPFELREMEKFTEQNAKNKTKNQQKIKI